MRTKTQNEKTLNAERGVMTPAELTGIRKEIKFDKTAMAACLGLPKTTYQRYEDGSAAISEQVARKVLEIRQINITFMQELPQRVEYHVKRQFPQGFLSEVEAE